MHAGMLDISDTGYEGRFDFPWCGQRPDIVYMLASVPRSGSTWFSHLLWKSGCLGAPLEYLNFDRNGPYYFVAHSPPMQLDLWRSVMRRRTSPNGVFGFKCFPTQLQSLKESNPELLARLNPGKIVYFGRRDRAAHVVSLARAAMSGIWNDKQAQGREPKLVYSDEAMDAAENGIMVQEAAWESMFRSFGVAPLRLWYEDALAEPDEAVRQVADYLGIVVTPGVEVEVPEMRRQAGAESMAWAERYRQSRSATPEALTFEQDRSKN